MIEERTKRLRQALLGELSEARQGFEQALVLGNSNKFTWHGEEFWVDRVRCLIIPAGECSSIRSEAWVEPDTLPTGDNEAMSSLEFYGGERQLEDTGSILRIWTMILCKVASRHSWSVVGAKMLNLTVAQPFINPAFASLFWLALADDLGLNGDYRTNLFDLIETTIYAQIEYPKLVPTAEDVRRAQISFLEGLFPGTTSQSCETITDEEWAQRCSEVLASHQSFVDERVFYSLLQSVGGLDEPGAQKPILAVR